MKLNGIKIIAVLLLFVGTGVEGFAQSFSAGEITFVRKTNVQKKYKGSPMARWMKDAPKTKVDTFKMYFNDTMSAFVPVIPEIPEENPWLTSKHTTVQNFNKDERIVEYDFWSQKLYLKDTANDRQWKMTGRTRDIAGYECRMAVHYHNDSTRLYAWYAQELLLSTGPETFNGLPGVILGLATEDGGVVYFAKEVKVDPIDIAKYIPEEPKQKDIYNEESLRALVLKSMGGRGGPDMAKRMVEDMFMW